MKTLVKNITPESSEGSEVDSEKLLKSKKLSIQERLAIIKEKVIRVLGKQRLNTVTIRNLNDFSAYIDKAIAKGIIPVDTETNNSLDPVTCKLMGLCLYVPGEKQAYIPVNHVDLETGELLPDQITTEEIRRELQRLKDNKVFIVMHNGKFDFEVIKTTCGIELPPDWDTFIAARLIDENDLAGLKYLYVKFIDPTQAKYDIEGLFENVQYALLDPELFALYAATDSMMTYKLYEYQKNIMLDPSMERVYWVFQNIEMPIVVVTANMELRGVKVDTNFGEKLKLKYNKQLSDIDEEIANTLASYQDIIKAWRENDENKKPARVYTPKKSKKSLAQLEEEFPCVDNDKDSPNFGKRYKLGKSRAEQLADPINLASPVQLAILFYDVLGAPQVSKKSPRGTGEDELKAILEKMPELKLCDLILKRRGIVKLITTYIDVIPDLVKHWPDGRIRFHLNSMGTDTGRYSSGGKLKFFENGEPIEVSGINVQNIPSHNKEIRLLFQGDTKYHEVEVASPSDWFDIPETDEVETLDGWKFASELEVGDEVNLEEETGVGSWHIQAIEKCGKIYRIRF